MQGSFFSNTLTVNDVVFELPDNSYDSDHVIDNVSRYYSKGYRCDIFATTLEGIKIDTGNSIDYTVNKIPNINNFSSYLYRDERYNSFISEGIFIIFSKEGKLFKFSVEISCC